MLSFLHKIFHSFLTSGKFFHHFTISSSSLPLITLFTKTKFFPLISTSLLKILKHLIHTLICRLKSFSCFIFTILKFTIIVLLSSLFMSIILQKLFKTSFILVSKIRNFKVYFGPTICISIAHSLLSNLNPFNHLLMLFFSLFFNKVINFLMLAFIYLAYFFL